MASVSRRRRKNATLSREDVTEKPKPPALTAMPSPPWPGSFWSWPKSRRHWLLTAWERSRRRFFSFTSDFEYQMAKEIRNSRRRGRRNAGPWFCRSVGKWPPQKERKRRDERRHAIGRRRLRPFFFIGDGVGRRRGRGGWWEAAALRCQVDDGRRQCGVRIRWRVSRAQSRFLINVSRSR